MRDTDCDLTSVVVVRADSGIDRRRRPARASGRRRRDRLAPGHADPALDHLRAAGLRPGQRLRGAPLRRRRRASTATTSAASATRPRALLAGEVDAACMIDGNHLASRRRAPCRPARPGSSPQTAAYDHCNFTVVAGGAGRARRALRASCCWPWATTTPRSGRCSTSRGSSSGGRAASAATRQLEAGGRRGPGSTTRRARHCVPTIDLEGLGLDRGGHLLRRARPRRRRRRRASRARSGRPARSWPCTCAAWCRRPGHWLPTTWASSRRRDRAGHPRRGRGPLAGRRRARPARARPASADGPPAAWGLAARGALVEAGGAAVRTSPSTDKDEVWADVAAGSTPRPPPRQWDPATAVDWDAPFDHAAGGRGGRRPGHDLPDRERAGRAGRAGPLPRPDPPPLPRGACSSSPCRPPTRPATSRSSPAGPACAARPLGASTRRRPGVAPDPARRARLLAGLFLLSVLGEGTLPRPAGVPRAPRPRPGHPRRSPASPCRTRPATSPSAWPTSSTRLGGASPASGPPARGRRAPPRRPGRHRRPERRGLRRPGRAGRRLLDAGAPSPPATPRCPALQAEHGRGPPPPPGPPRLPARRGGGAVALHTRNFM